ncbi:hypothetical protein ZEAMMB73_Zm00001d002875 [Zea mays]|uniref:Uncharacterized protein n=1 Tax=Zea mays TaxID=4577 RepID=B6TCY4_MAIZE|nr:hypothetical protein [Zea mays]ONM15546.1 hypothetical protein ZEAMMB73_Zm00001d002875 [Zea mays]ONM15547.1 hypothetical protein ZEAMMB73_Zm00001d002875 [Zea mays]ONM15550.1 hypothetical protein ZEAMMB73_Zm00001d002875 [Zea mays]ONM15553.1 hypothetical protein ZEAMMB73_Zm00001d002875 [Zea mays]
MSLLKELNEKDNSLKDHRLRVNNLGEQLDLLQKDVQAREVTQMQLKDIVIRIETNIMDEVAKAFEIAMLRGEIRILSTHWTNKTKNLESQLKKHQRTDQELKKRVLKLEFCLWSCHPLVRSPPHLPLLLAPLLFSCCDWDIASWILNLGQNLGRSRTTMMPGTYSYFIHV